MKIFYDTPAQLELADAARYYSIISSAVVVEFTAEFDAAVSRILERPRAWRPWGKGLRRCLLTDFSYQLVYKIVGENIRVYAFAHLSRRPNYWRKGVP